MKKCLWILYIFMSALIIVRNSIFYRGTLLFEDPFFSCISVHCDFQIADMV
jgi:hypothetical protein